MNGRISSAGTADARYYFLTIALDLDAMFRKYKLLGHPLSLIKISTVPVPAIFCFVMQPQKDRGLSKLCF